MTRTAPLLDVRSLHSGYGSSPVLHGVDLQVGYGEVVGLLGPNPIQGVLVLGWGLLYQQVENLTIEPRISAKAVDAGAISRNAWREIAGQPDLGALGSLSQSL